MPRRPALLLVLLLAQSVWAQGELRFLTATNHGPPLLQFEEGAIKGGLLVDIEQALARRMGLKALHIPMPSLRVPAALRAGSADLLCYTRPEWIDGEFRWSRSFLETTEVLAATREAPPIRRLEDLRGKPVGTVRGYRYPALDKTLRGEYQRLDAADMRANLDKLVAARMHYALTDRFVLREWQRRHPGAGLREELAIAHFSTACALSPHSYLSLPQLDAALDAMAREGELRAILRRHGQ